MKSNLFLEFKRGILSKKFLIAILLNCLCLAVGIYSNHLALLMFKGLVLFYIGYILSPGGILVVMAPIIVALPFAASFVEDKERFFLKNLLIRESRTQYFLKKYLVTGLLGSLAVALPLILLLLINIIFFPKGDFNLGSMTGAFHEIYERSKLAYAIISIANATIFGFIYANIGLTISFFIRNKVMAIVAPFLLYILPAFFFIYLNLSQFEPTQTFTFNGNSDKKAYIIASEFLFLLMTSIIAGYIKFIKIDRDEV
ncbi:MAG: hypothetical protein LBI41_02550 [Lactobacillales bacterium]|nr:hypothetical protein [Lactobacillales bacterium]